MSEPINRLPLGTLFRQKREEKGLLVRQVAAVTELDQAIISRIENNDRLPTKEQLNKLAGLYGLDLRDIYSTWLSEKMIRDYGDEPYAPEAFREAHDHVIIYQKSVFQKNTNKDSNSTDLSLDVFQGKKPPAKPGSKPSKT